MDHRDTPLLVRSRFGANADGQHRGWRRRARDRAPQGHYRGAGVKERDLTGDGRADVLRLIGRGRTVDSLGVTFSIESSGRIVFELRCSPLTRTVGLDARRRRLSPSAHRTRLREYGVWFLEDGKFTSVDGFVGWLRDAEPRHVALVPHVIPGGLPRDTRPFADT